MCERFTARRAGYSERYGSRDNPRVRPRQKRLEESLLFLSLRLFRPPTTRTSITVWFHVMFVITVINKRFASSSPIWFFLYLFGPVPAFISRPRPRSLPAQGSKDASFHARITQLRFSSIKKKLQKSHTFVNDEFPSSFECLSMRDSTL